jgi:hypothetical protein
LIEILSRLSCASIPPIAIVNCEFHLPEDLTGATRKKTLLKTLRFCNGKFAERKLALRATFGRFVILINGFVMFGYLFLNHANPQIPGESRLKTACKRRHRSVNCA